MSAELSAFSPRCARLTLGSYDGEADDEPAPSAKQEPVKMEPAPQQEPAQSNQELQAAFNNNASESAPAPTEDVNMGGEAKQEYHEEPQMPQNTEPDRPIGIREDG